MAYKVARQYKGDLSWATPSRRIYRRRSYRRSGTSVRLSPEFLAGVVVGFTDLDDKIPAELVLGVAAAPVTGIGKVKAAAQGIIIGNLVQTISKKGISGSSYQGMTTL